MRLNSTESSKELTQYTEQIENALLGPWAGVRADLILHASQEDETGQATWLLEDPVAGSLFKLGLAEYQLFSVFRQHPQLQSAFTEYRQHFHHYPDPVLTTEFLHFLHEHALGNRNPEQSKQSTNDTSRWRTAARSVISLRIPLLRPDGLLNSALPLIRGVWHPIMRMLWLLIAVLGLGLAIPQYELYFSSIGHLITPTGMAWFAVCLVLLKIGHEFSHALVAKHYGLYVPRMGVVLIVFWPVLYTDTSHAWKLPQRRQRLHIDLAGVSFELVIAGLTLFIWSLLPDGLLRNLMFYFSSTSIVTSLLINLNPLMRFDGYYILMDIWGIDNLQSRSFALVRHRLRRLLWDWQAPPPEVHEHTRKMTIYGFAVMLYRVMLSMVIAAAIYYLVHPWLGLVAWSYVVFIMIGAPLSQEIRVVMSQRKLMGKPWRRVLGVVLPLGLIALLFIPYRSAYQTPAMVLLADADHINAPGAAQLVSDLPVVGHAVVQGDILARLKNADLDHEAASIKFNVQRIQAEISRLSTGGEQGAYRQWLQADLQREQAKLAKLVLAKQQLVLRARRTGVVVYRNDKVAQGMYLKSDSHLLTVAEPSDWEVHAYIHEQDVQRVVAMQQQAELDVPGFDMSNTTLRVTSAQPVRVQQFPNPSLYDVHGGPIAAKKDGESLVPRQSWYQITYQLRNVSPQLKALKHGMPAQVKLGDEKQSIMRGWYESIVRLLADDGVL